MATPTTRAALVKSDYGEDQDVAVLNANWDKVDAQLGASPVTSSTRPGTPYGGRFIYETDTKKAYVYDSVANQWVLISGQVVARANTATNPSTAGPETRIAALQFSFFPLTATSRYEFLFTGKTLNTVANADSSYFLRRYSAAPSVLGGTVVGAGSVTPNVANTAVNFAMRWEDVPGTTNQVWYEISIARTIGSGSAQLAGAGGSPQPAIIDARYVQEG